MKLLILGAGSIGARHARNSVCLAHTAVYDPDTTKTQNLANEIGVTTFDQEKQAWDWNPDGVVIATPHKSHLALARKAIDTGIPALVEKPLSYTMNGVEDLLVETESSETALFVVTNMRFHPAVECLRSNLYKIGRTLFVRSHYGNYLPNMRPDGDYKSLYASSRKEGGGVILDAIHEIDYLSWFFGDVLSVTADTGTLSDLEIDVEDYATIIMNHSAGMRSVITVDYLQQYKRRGCEIIGSNGTLIWQSEGKSPEQCIVKLYDKNQSAWEVLYEDRDLNTSRPYEVMIEKFVKAITQNDTELASVREGASALKVALASLKSAEEGKIVWV